MTVLYDPAIVEIESHSLLWTNPTIHGQNDTHLTIGVDENGKRWQFYTDIHHDQDGGATFELPHDFERLDYDENY